MTVGVHAVSAVQIAMSRHTFYGGIDCPSCYSCDDCDDDHKPPEAIEVDLGTWSLVAAASITLTIPSGSWTGAPLCAWCGNVGGKWIVINPSTTACIWVGGQADVCTVRKITEGPVVGTDDGSFIISLAIVSRPAGKKRWELSMGLGGSGTVGPDGWPVWEGDLTAYYASTDFGTDECDVFPRTLTLTDIYSYGYTYSMGGCAGTPPTTITLNGPP
jgi:hypothetical protein